MNGSPRIQPSTHGLSVLLIAVVLLGMAIRLSGIHLEPIWLDEAFSVEFSNGSVADVLRVNARDAHPPLYYLTLKMWRAVFGDSVTALRSLSTFWSGFGLAIIVLFTWHLTRSEKAMLIAGTLGAINPLDVYYAQETRMFTQVAALGLFSSWCLFRWLESRDVRRPERGFKPGLWLAGYVVSGAAALLSHYMAVFLLASQGILALGWCARRRDLRCIVGCALAILSIGLLFIPWILFTHGVGAKLYSNEVLSWIPQPAASEMFSFLFSDFYFPFAPMPRQIASLIRTGSVALAIGVGVNFAVAAIRKRVAALPALFLGWSLFAPVVAAFLVSVAYHPVYYQPRFVVMVLPYFILLLTISVWQIRPAAARWAAVVVACGLMLIGTIFQCRHITKIGMSGFPAEYTSGLPPDHVVMFPRHNAILASYYLGHSIGNPQKRDIERDLRSDFPSRIWVCVAHGYLKTAPPVRRAFHDWLISLGPRKPRAAVDGMNIIEVRAQPLKKTYPPLVPGDRIGFSSDAAPGYLWNGWYYPEEGFRWSRGTRAQFLFSLSGAVDQVAKLRLKIACFHQQDITVELNGVFLESFHCSQRRFHERQISIPAGATRLLNRLEFHLPKAISPSAVSGGDDKRMIAMAIAWLEIQ
jgi:hypothetical protein